MQRCLQEKATNISCLQSGQRTRANPSCRSPHLRKAATDCWTIGRQKHDRHVGIVYEGSQSHLVFEKFTLDELLKR